MKHQPLFKALTELYTLHIQLGHLPESALITPNEDSVFNRTAALEAGYTAEAVRVMSRMPYLEAEWYEALPNTHVQNYISSGRESVEAYRERREVFANPGVVVPGHVLGVTTQIGPGYTYLYDTDRTLLYEYAPFVGDDYTELDLSRLPARPPRAVLGRWITAFRHLKIFKYENAGWCRYPGKPVRHPDADIGATTEAYRQVELGIRDLYLEAGWDVGSETQEGFDVEEFLEKREGYVQEVMRPVLEGVEKAHRLFRRVPVRDEL